MLRYAQTVTLFIQKSRSLLIQPAGLRNSKRNTISSNNNRKDERETVHLFFINFRFLKNPLTPANDIIIRIEPEIMRIVMGSEKKITPRKIAKIILADDINEPAVALICLYPAVRSTCPIKESTAIIRICSIKMPAGITNLFISIMPATAEPIVNMYKRIVCV
jgi:hypothetical protein